VEDQAGTTLRGRFRLDQRIGQGAIGTVWRGTDVLTSHVVAIKLLKTPNAAATTMFLREIEALAELKHPNIVGYVDHGLAENGEPYLAMEWLEGTDLQTYLSTKKLTAEEGLLLARQALSALSVAHGRGIVHRDLKPANIFLCDGKIEQLKLVDFGIAKRLLDAPNAGIRTAIGTPMYMSPEQARGLSTIDGRSDIFSLGSVLYEALSGTPAFPGETSLAVLAKVCVDEPIPLRNLCPKLSSGFREQITLMLAKAPSQRPQDAEKLLQSLLHVGIDATHEVQAYSDSLSMEEQRVVVVLMSKLGTNSRMSSDGNRLNSSPGSPPKIAALPRSLIEAFEKMELEVNHLVDGTLLVTCSGNATAPELAAKSARCAMALRKYSAESCTAISMGKTVVRQGLPLGKLVDETTSRLAKTGAGEISVDEDTAGLIGRMFAVHGHHGRWLLVDDSYATPLPVSVSNAERKFIGRDTEIDWLLQSLSKTIETSNPTVSLFVAEAGVGKTKLASEFLGLARKTIPHRYSVWQAQSDSMMAATPLAFARQLAMRTFSISEDTPKKLRRAYVTSFLTHGKSTEHAAVSIAYLAELVAASPTDESEKILRTGRSDPRVMAEQMSLAFADAIRTTTANQPLIMMLDDLHWADLASIKLLNGALSQCKNVPCFVLAMARPEIDQRHPTLWQEVKVERRKLLPLNEQESLRLIKQLLPSDRLESTSWLAERAEGNPYFIEELARALRRRGTTEIPDAVLGTVQARLDDLPAPARRVLRAASIFGRQFSRTALPPLLGDEELADLNQWLTFLQHEEILQTQDEMSLRFSQDLTREATYQSLTDGDRILGHRLAGRWLEAEGQTPASVLLEHFSRACDLPRSCLLAEQAAADAYAAADLEGSIAFAERGCSFGPEPQQAGRLKLLQANAQRWLGRMQDTLLLAEQAMKLLQPGTTLWFEGVGCCGRVLAESLDTVEILDLSETARSSRPRDSEASNARSIAMAELAGGLMDAGFLKEGVALLNEAEGCDGFQLRPEALNRILHMRGKYEKRLWKLGAARTALEGAVEAGIEAGDELLQGESRNNLSVVLLDAGMYEEAKVYLQTSLAFSRRMRSLLLESVALANLGLIEMTLGFLLEAGVAINQAAVCVSGRGLLWIERIIDLYKAHLSLAQNNPSAGRPFVQPFLDDPQLLIVYRPYALALAAQIELREGNPKLALQIAEEGRVLIDDDGILPEEGEMYFRLTHAQALLACERREDAQKGLVNATEKLTSKAHDMDDPVMEAAFMAIPTHRSLFELLAQLQRAQ
jgi:eukaryotic-like serine/threonine-protein kinase